MNEATNKSGRRVMQRRSFNGGVDVSVLGIGGGRIGSLNNPVPMREIERMLTAAVEAGVNLFDTADIYGQGDSERALGRLTSRHPGRAFIITKIGFTHGRYANVVRTAKPILRLLARSRVGAQRKIVHARSHVMDQDFSITHLRHATDASRRRLGVDRLDGLLLHNPPLPALQHPRTADFLREIVRDEVASHVGVSTDMIEDVEAALTIPAVTMLQVPLTIAMEMGRSEMANQVRDRRIALFVREILFNAGPERSRADVVRTALAVALAPDFVTAAIVGVSTRHHLDGLLAAMP
jgi:aryl-alcohol dehydrogenase-like predicted oxidoreductase